MSSWTTGLGPSGKALISDLQYSGSRLWGEGWALSQVSRAPSPRHSPEPPSIHGNGVMPHAVPKRPGRSAWAPRPPMALLCPPASAEPGEGLHRCPSPPVVSWHMEGRDLTLLCPLQESDAEHNESILCTYLGEIACRNQQGGGTLQRACVMRPDVPSLRWPCGRASCQQGLRSGLPSCWEVPGSEQHVGLWLPVLTL